MRRFKNVLIASAGVGAGHRRAAEALERAFHVTDAAEKVRHLDALDYSTPLLRAAYAKGYSYLARHMPAITASLYDAMDRPQTCDRNPRLFDRWNTRRFLRLVREYAPELVVCTHFLPAALMSWEARRQRLRPKLAIVVTDFDVHALWLCGPNVHYFVATHEARMYLERLGLPASHVSACGIPIDPILASLPRREIARASLGLEADRCTILVSGARLHTRTLEQVIHSLSRIRQLAQVIVLCGGNARAKRCVEDAARYVGPGQMLSAIGYSETIGTWMAAADVFVGRPGGLTVAETLAARLVMVIIEPIPGQEERNADHLLEEGVALRCNDLQMLGDKIDRLLNDPQRLERMRAKAAELSRPRAAIDIVEALGAGPHR